MSDARDELEIANGQLAVAQAFAEALAKGVPDPVSAANVFLEWLISSRTARAAAIREAIDGEPVCTCCSGPLTCKGCSWGC